MKFFKKLVSVITVIALVVSIIGMSPVVNAKTENVDHYISELISYYKNYQEDANTDIERLLNEISVIDSTLAKTWEKIMDYWSEVNSDGFTNVGEVPIGLPTDDSIAIVVLGFALNDDGTMKEELVGRLQTGLDIAKQYPHSYIVVTGGGTAKNNPNVTEGGLMGEWFIEQGLDKNRVIIENQAPNTVGNAENTYAILNEKYPNVDSVVLVTSDYHVPRGCLLYNSKFILEAFENKSQPIDIIANAGYSTGTSGYESISLQATGLASVAGGSVNANVSVELSKLKSLTIKQKTMYETGQDLDFIVTAKYDSGYERDVTDFITITGFDHTQDKHQVVNISYKENDIEIKGKVTLTNKETYISLYESLLTNLVNEGETKDLSLYTKESVDVFNYALQAGKTVLNDKNHTEKELIDAYQALSIAFDSLKEESTVEKTISNLALYSHVSANSGTTKAHVITDGKIKNEYSNSNTGISDSYVIVELPYRSEIQKVKVVTYYNNKNKYYNFDILISDDQLTWTSIGKYETPSNPGTDGYVLELDEVVNAKYVKIQGLDTNNDKLHLVEVEIYGSTPLENIAFNKNVTASHDVTNANKVVDGQVSYWSAEGIVSNKNEWPSLAVENRPYVIIDLESEYKLDLIEVMNYCDAGRYYKYNVYTSHDGITFDLLYEKSDTNTAENISHIHVDDNRTARYIKVEGTHNSANTAYHISEIRVYGEATSQDLADYSAVYEAISKVPEDLDDYTYTSVVKLKTAVALVNYHLTQAQQSIVDHYALEIEAAIHKLILKNGADYTVVENALSKVPTNLNGYTQSSKEQLQQAINAVDYKLPLSKQDEVNAFAIAIEKAIERLRPRINIISYVKDVTSNAIEINDGDITKIYDGKNSTYCTFNEPGIEDLEIVFELDAYYDLEEIVVRPYHKADDASVRSYFYDLYVSEDGGNWVLVAKHTTQGTTDAGNSHKIDVDIDVKYIKIDGTGKINPGSQTNQAFHLSEVYAYGEESRNIVLNKSFTSSGEDTSASSSATAITSKAVDGDRSTYWDAGAYASKPWIDIDLEDVYVLDQVNVVTYVGSGRYYHYDIYASIDGINYYKIAAKSDNIEPTKQGTTFEFDEVVYASHIKVVGTYHSRNSAFHIAELRAYGRLANQNELLEANKQAAIYELEAIINNTYRSDYTQESWEGYKAVREEAYALLKDSQATVSQYKKMTDKLKNAKDDLVMGNPDNKEDNTFRVASFNIWAPNPKHPNVKAINEELLRCQIDFAGIQEVDKNNKRDNRDVLQLIADDDYHYSYMKSIDYKDGEYGIGQLSALHIKNIESGQYSKVNDEEGRSWQRIVVEFEGKDIAIYNTHLSVGGGVELNSNINEILEIMKNDGYEYKLLTGDFNATRENMDPFKESYYLANGNDGLWYSTFDGDKYANGAGYLDGMANADITSGIDNIVYSKNLEISNVRVVHNDDLSDHYMIYADFKILSYEDDLKELVDSLTYLQENYTEETWLNYSEKLEKAKELLDHENYVELQNELKEAFNELNEAIDALVLKDANYDVLDDILVEYEKQKEHKNLYTEESWQTVQDAVDAVIYGLDITKQEDVDAMVKAIEEALSNLKEKVTVDSNLPIESDKLPAKTGDNTNIAFYGIMVVLGLLFLNKKRIKIRRF